MLEQIKGQWNEIIEYIKTNSVMSEVAINSWILPVSPSDIHDNTLFLEVSDEKKSSFINNRYKSLFKTSILAVTGFDLEIEILSKKEIEDIFSKIPSLIVGDNQSFDSNELLNKKKEANINPKYTFDNFVVGNSNNYAQAYSIAVAESPGNKYNPLFIYGGVGLGKTHLLHSIGNYVLEHNPDAKVRCVNSESFTNEVINAIRSENQSAINEFREKYRNIDVFIIDDIQFIIGKARSQEEFFHTFNILYENEKQIVISSDKAPKNLSPLEERFKSRFESGIMVDISSPEYETRMAILNKKAEMEHLNISDEVLKYIADNIESNIRELEGALKNVISFSKISKKEITIDFAKEVLKDIISPNKNNQPTSENIINIVAEHYNITPTQMVSSSRTAGINMPRQVAMYLIKYILGLPDIKIAACFNKKDHTTVLHARNNISTKMKEDPAFNEQIEALIKKINPN